MIMFDDQWRLARHSHLRKATGVWHGRVVQVKGLLVVENQGSGVWHRPTGLRVALKSSSSSSYIHIDLVRSLR
jgi:hypothetical protein